MAGLGVVVEVWRSWPITNLAGLQVWGFAGAVFGAALAGAVVGALCWKPMSQLFRDRH